MIKLERVTSGYNRQPIVKNINLRFEKGKVSTIIGKNGSGKTTLLRTASHLLKPFSGDIFLKGQNIREMSPNQIARQISFLPQTRNVPNISVYDLVMHGRYPYMGFSRIPQKGDKKIVEESLEKMGITNYRNQNVETLSGGEQQKVYLAMTLAQNTDVLFLDEPTTYLDIYHQLEILNIIRRLKDMGKTIILVLHDLNNALSFSDKIYLMDKGNIAVHGTQEEIIKSGELERIFHVSCRTVQFDDSKRVQFLFTLVKK